MENNFNTPDFGAGDALLEALKEFGLLTESACSKIESMCIITEASKNTPNSFEYNGHYISWELLKAVYQDYDRYPHREDVWKALGYPFSSFLQSSNNDPNRAASNVTRRMHAMLTHFRETNPEARRILVPFDDRSKHYSKMSRIRRAEKENDLDPTYGFDSSYAPDRSDIDPGIRGRNTRATRAIERINSQSLVTGEFYSDASRIPPSRWGNWLRFWDKEKSPVRQTVNLFGRSWKKTFVLGYQVEAALLYEIWYNSLDSSFSLYDFRGSQLSRAFPTLSEATKALMNALAQRSSKDAAFFSSGMNNPVATSMFRAMTNDLDSRIDDLRRLENKEQEDAAREQKRREEENKKRKEMGNLAYFKDRVERTVTFADDDGDSTLSKDIATAKRWARATADVAKNGMLDKWLTSANGKLGEESTRQKVASAVSMVKAGRMSVDSFATTVSQAFGVVGMHQEQILRDALAAGEISILDYLDGIRELGKRANTKSRFEDTPIRPQPVNPPEPERPEREDISGLRDVTPRKPVMALGYTPSAPEREEKKAPDLSATWTSGTGEYSSRMGDMPSPTATAYSVKNKVADGLANYVENKKKKAAAKKTATKKPATPKKPAEKKPAAPKKKSTSKKVTEALTFENLLDRDYEYDAQAAAVKDDVDSSHTSMIRGMRSEALKGQFTQAAIKNSVNSELLSVYSETRVDPSFVSNYLTGWLNRGRKDPIVLPTDKPGILDRLKLLVRGHRYHADFVVGFSLKDAVNIEVWYIVEPNPEYSFNPLADNGGISPTVASFYVFDVTSARLIRKYVPYYRNAVQIAMAKLSAQ